MISMLAYHDAFFYERSETPWQPLGGGGWEGYFRRNSTVELLSGPARGKRGTAYTGRKQSAINHAGYVSLSIPSNTIHIDGFSFIETKPFSSRISRPHRFRGCVWYESLGQRGVSRRRGGGGDDTTFSVGPPKAATTSSPIRR